MFVIDPGNIDGMIRATELNLSLITDKTILIPGRERYLILLIIFVCSVVKPFIINYI